MSGSGKSRCLALSDGAAPVVADMLLTGSARGLYLSILLSHPLSPYAQSLDPVWLSTTHILIASYRQQIAHADAALTALPSRPKRTDPAHQALTKALTRFRQALASDETFYRSLIQRFVAFFHLQPLVGNHLAAVGIPVPLAQEGEKLRMDPKEKVGLVYKGLICLGDLERYKEQYSDEMRRGNVRGEAYGKASRYYEVARGLIPDDGESESSSGRRSLTSIGTAFNQLAVIATYVSDDFLATYHYFRALAIKIPFKSAEEILSKFLQKRIQRWRSEGSSMDGPDDVEKCKRHIVILAGLLFDGNLCAHLPISQAVELTTHRDQNLGDLVNSTVEILARLLRDRALPSETIVKMTSIIIGIHWHTRHASSLSASQTARDAEFTAFELLLSTCSTMLRLASEQMDSETTLAEDDLHQAITAPLRRILPALRLVSKWSKLHNAYVARLPLGVLNEPVTAFNSAYMQCLAALANNFALDLLPALEGPLEEDVDMRGFLPLSRALSVGGESGAAVHPNEEQLMRIADLQIDARLLLRPAVSLRVFG